MKRKIGLLGLTFTDPNKGCEALTYTFLNMLQDFYKDSDIDVLCIWNSNDLGKIPQYFPRMKFEAFVLNIYSLKSWFDAYNEIKTCDCVFDASYGDGFTGIYGTRRNFVQALRKQLVVSAHKPLFLLPQTYGKYKFPFVGWSISLIKKASLAYARDEQTAKSIGDFVKITSDMAFALPFDETKYPIKGEKKKIGINVSSLLWDDNTRRRFNLTVDYKKFYFDLLDFLINKTEYEVHLIPHVLDMKNYNAPENDYRVLDELKRHYGDNVILAPPFDTAIDAKSYICHMDVFLGSRMHATIGAISSGVTTIPFSYAHKFEALYSHIGYPYVISATKCDTEHALEMVKEWVSNPLPLHESGVKAVLRAKAELKNFENDLYETLKQNNLI